MVLKLLTLCLLHSTLDSTIPPHTSNSGQWSDTISQCRTTWPINMNISAGGATVDQEHCTLHCTNVQTTGTWKITNAANVSFLFVMVSLWKIEGVDGCGRIRPRYSYSYQGIFLVWQFEITAYFFSNCQCQDNC